MTYGTPVDLSHEWPAAEVVGDDAEDVQLLFFSNALKQRQHTENVSVY